MEGVILLSIIAFTFVIPIVLGRWALRSPFPRALLALMVPGLAVFAGWQFRKADELEALLDRSVSYPVPAKEVGRHSIVIAPIQGRGVSGLNIRVVQFGDGPRVTQDFLKSMDWKMEGDRTATDVWYSEYTRGAGIPLLERSHHWGKNDPIVLTYVVSEQGLSTAAGLDLKVGLDSCSRKDIEIGRLIEFWLGVLASIAAGISLCFLVAWLLVWKSQPSIDQKASLGT